MLAQFLLKAGQPDHLKDAPGGAQYLSASATVLDRGKEVFADRCARCHSSKLPIPAQGLDLGGCAGPHYLACWNRYWEWTKTDDFKQKMRQIVKAPDFLDSISVNRIPCKCPDYVVNRGHYFGTDKFSEEPGLSDDDKRALIEFLKTF
jgi:hypothetical protein